ncbi:MAG: cob(I)yrinic acid a,c-diamide adenosyltransferase [Nitrospirales bacterium]|nr:cob(I)yrinic acid a,c-diamide adenosyltransferase [Nitrospirales bacterium]
MRKGYIQIYTGNSKGKTTAALGLALRASGAGLRVFIGQFIKSRLCSEHKALERFSDLIEVRQYGTGFIFSRKPTDEEIAISRKGLEEAKVIVSSGEYGLVILDEINVAAHSGLITTDDILDLMARKHPETELILTGRYADERVMERADLVTEMREIKHYADEGVPAREGIEF